MTPRRLILQLSTVFFALVIVSSRLLAEIPPTAAEMTALSEQISAEWRLEEGLLFSAISRNRDAWRSGLVDELRLKEVLSFPRGFVENSLTLKRLVWWSTGEHEVRLGVRMFLLQARSIERPPRTYPLTCVVTNRTLKILAWKSVCRSATELKSVNVEQDKAIVQCGVFGKGDSRTTITFASGKIVETAIE